MKLKNKVAGIFLLSLGCGAAALSLGEMRGAAWVGQALDVRISIELDEATRMESLCLDADVMYGEVQQASGRIRVSLEPSQRVEFATARIQSLNPVNEPVVMVNLKAGCLAKTERRYVLLAEVPAGPTFHANGVAESTVSLPIRTVEPTIDKPKTVVLMSSRVLKERAQVRSISQYQVQRPASTVRRADKLQARKSRLSLDPLEPLELRFERAQKEPSAAAMSIQMAVLPADLPTQGLEVEAAQKDQRLKKLESDLLSMQGQLAEREQGLSQLRDRLKQVESERYDNLLVYALSALLMGAVLALAYLLQRQAKTQAMMSQAWFEAVKEVDDQADRVIAKKPSTPADPPKTIAVTEQVLNVDSVASPHELMDIDLDNLVLESAYKGGEPTDAIRMQRHNNAAFLGLQVHGEAEASNDDDQSQFQFNKASVRVDPRQQADFYVSLGQSDQAIKILNTAIEKDEKTSPMVYLDLLKIYHSMGMRDEYLLLSEKFAQLFKARVPDYAGFRREGQDLMAYEGVIAQISLHWSSPQVIDVINTFVYTDPFAGIDEKIDLQAFRDLLLLRAVAQDKLEAPHPEGHSSREMSSIIWQG